jgi:hypothetical protein
MRKGHIVWSTKFKRLTANDVDQGPSQVGRPHQRHEHMTNDDKLQVEQEQLINQLALSYVHFLGTELHNRAAELQREKTIPEDL